MSALSKMSLSCFPRLNSCQEKKATDSPNGHQVEGEKKGIESIIQ